MKRPAKPPKAYAVYLGIVCTERGWAQPEAEVMLIPGRRFRCDFAWPAHRLVVEVQGGVWLPKGGHTGGKAQIDDMEKLNLLTLAGWRVLQVTPKQVVDGTLPALLAQAFAVAA